MSISCRFPTCPPAPSLVTAFLYRAFSPEVPAICPPMNSSLSQCRPDSPFSLETAAIGFHPQEGVWDLLAVHPIVTAGLMRPDFSAALAS